MIYDTFDKPNSIRMFSLFSPFLQASNIATFDSRNSAYFRRFVTRAKSRLLFVLKSHQTHYWQ